MLFADNLEVACLGDCYRIQGGLGAFAAGFIRQEVASSKGTHGAYSYVLCPALGRCELCYTLLCNGVLSETEYCSRDVRVHITPASRHNPMTPLRFSPAATWQSVQL